MSNKNLNKAKKVKNDEFYTRLEDIEQELKHYKNHFKDKVVYCNCDDPRVSNFFKYFSLNFEHLGLKKLIATAYGSNEYYLKEDIKQKAIYGEYNGDQPIIKKLKGDGSFDSDECIEFLKEADIVVTNPPFSLFRGFVDLLMKYEKKFLIIGNLNAITYKNIFPLIKDNKIWLGRGRVKEFQDGQKGGFKKLGNTIWFTNLDHNQINEPIILYKRYNEQEYPKYDNYNIININKTKEIPMEYDGEMGVPISFLEKYNPNQFKIVKFINGSKLTINGKHTYERIIIKRNPLN